MIGLIEEEKICDIGLYVRPVSCFLPKPPAVRVPPMRVLQMRKGCSDCRAIVAKWGSRFQLVVKYTGQSKIAWVVG